MSGRYDTGHTPLDLIAACDEGKQEAAFTQDFSEAMRRTMELGASGKVVLTVKLTVEIQNVDEMLASVEYTVKQPSRKQKLPRAGFLDTTHRTDDLGMPTRGVESVTMHPRNPRQTSLPLPTRNVVSLNKKDRN